MKSTLKLAIAIVVSLSIACAGARDQSRVEPLLFLPQQREIAFPIRSVERPPAPFITATCNRGARGSERCDHVSIRLDGVLTAAASTIEERNQLIGLLLSVSDYNCSAFITRAFGRKARVRTASALLDNVNTALNARSGDDSSLATMLTLARNTAGDMQRGPAEPSAETAIMEARSKDRERIRSRAGESLDAYPLLGALSDIAAYDEICSLQRGKELALQAAANAREEELKTLAALLGLKQ